MSKKEDALFKEWAEEVSSKLSGAKLEAFNQLIADGDEGAKEVFRGAHRGEDYYRRLNELHEERREKELELANRAEALEARQREIMGWYEQESPKNAKLLKEKQELVSKLEETQRVLESIGLDDEAKKLASVGSGTSKKVESDMSNEKLAELEKKYQVLERGLPGLLSQFGKVIHQVTKEGWRVDPAAIIDHASKKGVDLETAFNQLTADERKERDETRLAELQKKWKEEGRREALSKAPNPDFQRPAGPTVLDALKQDTSKFQDRNARVASATQSFIGLDSAGT